ncbi:MAG: type II toxin-antitoxin system prevent-host-death family antitoxin [Synergistaceae bacterium]|nr:type II toxin-antitoxin system prevent-host-death family antitoxin [Synergistaceae bacterium]
MQVEYNEFKEKLPELMGKVLYGDEHQLTITKNGTPIAKLIDYYDGPGGVRIGVAKGKFTAPSLEEFDSMNDEIAEMFGVK